MRKPRLTVRLLYVPVNGREGNEVRIRSVYQSPGMAREQVYNAKNEHGWRQDNHCLDVVGRRLKRVEQIGEKIVVIHGRTLNHDLSVVGTPDCT